VGSFWVLFFFFYFNRREETMPLLAFDHTKKAAEWSTLGDRKSRLGRRLRGTGWEPWRAMCAAEVFGHAAPSGRLLVRRGWQASACAILRRPPTRGTGLQKAWRWNLNLGRPKSNQVLGFIYLQVAPNWTTEVPEAAGGGGDPRMYPP
jgi:hypothetical protein